jgi:hypothetical protein
MAIHRESESIMKLRTILGTILLGCTLTAPLALAAGPRTTVQPPTPSTEFSSMEKFCSAYGRFAYAYTLDRDAGIPLWEALRDSAQWDREHGAPPAIQRMHEHAIQALYRVRELGPIAIQQETELYCLKVLVTAPAPAGTTAR